MKQGKSTEPSRGILDAQSVKSTLVSKSSNTGYDGGKNQRDKTAYCSRCFRVVTLYSGSPCKHGR
ncbi:MAG: hypothetical protein IPJ81_07440 [Chitinophagaceae bacterium]|nr:hypothetical protein [Chitinophagaceae bacterium]